MSSQYAEAEATNLSNVTAKFKDLMDITIMPSEADLSPVVEAIAYGSEATSASAFSSEEWAYVWGPADAVCINLGAFPTHQSPGG